MIGLLLSLLAAGDLEEGIALFEAGRPAAALERLERAAAAAPRDPRPRLYAGLCLQDLHRLEEAIAALESARALGPADARVANALARALLDADRLADAAALLEEALLRHPEDADLLFAAGLAAHRSGRGPEARVFLERMLGGSPRHADAPRAHAILARILARSGEAAGAEEHRRLGEKKDLWQRAFATRTAQVREDPGDPLAWLGLGLLWMEAGEAARAEEALARACAADPKFARGRFHLGEARRARSDLRGALAAYREAAQIDPRYTRAHYHLGLAAANLGEAAEAARAFEAVLALDPEAKEDAIYRECWKHLGLLAEGVGDRETAKARYREYVRRGGKDPEVPRRLRALGG